MQNKIQNGGSQIRTCNSEIAEFSCEKDCKNVKMICTSAAVTLKSPFCEYEENRVSPRHNLIDSRF